MVAKVGAFELAGTEFWDWSWGCVVDEESGRCEGQGGDEGKGLEEHFR